MPPSSFELISAVSHPTRRRILRACLDRPESSFSAGELAPRVEARVGQVDYHLKTLARCDLLRPVRNAGREEPAFGWVLDVEAEWLRLVLDVWAGAELLP